MAWQHYTSYFKDGLLPPVLTYAMRQEIYDALKERIEGTFISTIWDIDQGYLDTILASKLQVDHSKEIKRINLPGFEPTIVQSLFSFIRVLAFEYHVNETTNQKWNTTGGGFEFLDVIAKAADDLGIDEFSILEESKIDTFSYWDIVRRAIMLLRYGHALFINPDTRARLTLTREGRGTNPRQSTWEDAVDNYYSKDLTSQAGLNRFRFNITSNLSATNTYVVNSIRTNAEISLPSSPILDDGYDAWAFVSVSPPVSSTIIGQWGSVESQLVVDSSNSLQKFKFSDVSGSGNYGAEISMRLKGDENGEDSDINLFEPLTSGTTTTLIQQLDSVAYHLVRDYFGFVIDPKFTHPYEEIE